MTVRTGVLAGVIVTLLAATVAPRAGAGTGVGAERPADTRPSDGPALALEAQVGGGVTSVEVRDGFAYAGLGSRLAVVDVSVPAGMRIVGETAPMPRSVVDLALGGDHAYLSVGDEGLVVVDISDPTAPAVVGRVTGLDADGGLAVTAGYAWVVSGPTVAVVDVADPLTPTVVASLPVRVHSARDVWVGGDKAYVVGEIVPDQSGELVAYDVSDPAAPALLGQVALARTDFDLDCADDVCVVAGRAATLRVVDVSDPSEPRVIAELDIADAYEATSVTLRGGTAYVGFSNQGVAVVDVSSPTEPRHLATVLSHGWPSLDAALSGDVLFLANEYHLYSGGGPGVHFQDGQSYWGLEAVDIGDPLQPRWLGGLSAAWYALSSAVLDGAALIGAGGSGLRTVDISDPSGPREGTPAHEIGNLVDVALVGRHALVASGYAGRLLVYGVGLPGAPSLVAQLGRPTVQSPSSVAVDGSRAYLVQTESDGALKVLDVLDPTRPIVLGAADIHDLHEPEVAARDGFAYLVTRTPGGQGRLDVIDATDPGAPRRTGSLRLDSAAFGVAVDPPYAYVAASADGLVVVDVGDPARPVVVGRAAAGWIATGVAFRWPYAFLTGMGGVAAIDATDPTHPVVVATLEHRAGPYAERATSPWLEGDRLFAPLYDQGLLVVRVTLPAAPTRTPTPTRTRTATATSTPTPTGAASASPTLAATPTVAETLAPTLSPTPEPTDTVAPTVGPTDELPATSQATAHSTTTASPSPSGTATPTPSPVATRRAVPLFLPLALDESCPPKGIYSDVVLVIDASTSMLQPAAPTRRKIDVATEAAALFLDGLRLRPDGDRAAIVTFNVVEHVLQGLTYERALLADALARVTTAEGSRLDLGIERAMLLHVTAPDARQVEAMIVLSDGMSNPVPGEEAVAAAQRAKLQGITMYVVGMGPSMDEDVLRRMASGPERFFPATDPLLVAEIYEDLTGRVPCPPEAYWGRR